jgi:hypothetical protein
MGVAMAGRASLWWALLSLVVACSGADRNFAGGSGSGGGGAGSESGGTAGTSGSTGPMRCMESMRRCDANTPQVCEAGKWVSEEPCAGATKACTGAGVCAAFRLTQGGLDAFNQRPAEKPSLVLKQQSLSAAPRVCAAALCVTATVE